MDRWDWQRIYSEAVQDIELELKFFQIQVRNLEVMSSLLVKAPACDRRNREAKNITFDKSVFSIII